MTEQTQNEGGTVQERLRWRADVTSVASRRALYLAAADEIERLRAALVRYGDALDELASPCEGVDTIHTMAERARQTINPELRPPVKPSVIP